MSAPPLVLLLLLLLLMMMWWPQLPRLSLQWKLLLRRSEPNLQQENPQHQSQQFARLEPPASLAQLPG